MQLSEVKWLVLVVWGIKEDILLKTINKILNFLNLVKDIVKCWYSQPQIVGTLRLVIVLVVRWH